MKKRWFFLVAIIFWTTALMSSLLWNLYSLDANTSELVRSVGRAFFKEIEVTRLWNARHGGVYVPITRKVQPNPYLQAPNRDVVTTEGMKLTKVNPAFMTRQIAEIAGQENDIQYHITSLNPLRPGNQADEWEAQSLKMFGEGLPDLTELIADQGVYRYMAPLFMKKACLACHAGQGYKVGDIRGGISVSIPAGVYVNAASSTKEKLIAIHLLIFLAGLAGLYKFVAFRDRQMAILNEKNAELEKEVENRKRVEKKLVKAKELAILANTAKGDFLANLSHEIRTPLNAIVGMADLLKETELSPERREFVDILDANSQSLLQLINDIIDLSKIEAGRIELEQVDFDLRELLEKSCRTLALAAHAKHLELALDIDHRVPIRVTGDPVRLSQIIINLINNAIKFTHEGEIVATCTVDRWPLAADEEAPVSLRFSIADTGIGVPAEKQKTIFEKFVQADTSTTREFGGTGLGLAICKKLAELMGGSLRVESEPAKGSTFSFTAEFSAAPAVHPERSAPSMPVSLQGHRFLIIDDNGTNRMILSKILAKWGIHTVEAEDGKTGLQALAEAKKRGQPFDLVLLDCRMPQMDGFEVARRIKENQDLASTMVMMLTSDDHRLSTTRCQEEGLSAYLVKPVRQDELLGTIRMLLGAGEHRKRGQKAPAPGEGPAVFSQAKRILLAEDYVHNRTVIQKYLQDFPFTIDVAENGLEAVEKLKTGQYDLILMDMQMPLMDGYEATGAIRAYEQASGRQPIPVVACTAHALQGDVHKCLAAGCNDYLSKPLTKAKLLATLQKYLAREEETEVRSSAPQAVKIDPDFMEFIPGFLEDVANDLEKMTAALAANDFETVRKLSHAIKGAGGGYGLAAVSEIAAALEEAARERAPGRIEREMTNLADFIKDIHDNPDR